MARCNKGLPSKKSGKRSNANRKAIADCQARKKTSHLGLLKELRAHRAINRPRKTRSNKGKGRFSMKRNALLFPEMQFGGFQF